MPEYRIKVSVGVTPYPERYGSHLEASHHEFFIEAPSAVSAMRTARADLFDVLDPLVTADQHDRDVAAELETKREAEAIARAQS